MWFNYHTHCTYCDGKSSVEEIIHEAKHLNLHSIGISSHAPLPFERPWCMKQERLTCYLDEIRKHENSGIGVYRGLEVDFIPGKIGPKEFGAMLDYTIGSIHFVESFDDGEGWEIDGTHHTFENGLEKIFKNNFQSVACRYFELTRQMIVESTPTIVGHLDKIKIQNHNNKYFHESDSWYRNEIIQTLDCLKKSGAILEVNTRGVYQKKSETTYPSPWILELALQKKIPITISSDAHHHKDLINCFDSGAMLLQQIGFHEISVLKNGTWTSVKFDNNGIDN